MRLGIGSYSLALNIVEGLSHEDLLDEAIRYACDSVQYCDNLSLLRLDSVAMARLASKGRSHGIVLEPGTRGIDREELTGLARIAQESGCGFVRLVIDRERDEPAPDEVVERLRFWREDVSETVLAIENHDRFPCQILADIVGRLGRDRYGVCLDTANSLGCLEGTGYVVHTLAPLTVNLHIKDIRISRTPSNMGFVVRGTAAGEGQIPIEWVVGQVKPTVESSTIEIWAEDADEERRLLGQSVFNMKRLLATN